jgi:acetolactate synthase-1/2/3 large subunit
MVENIEAVTGADVLVRQLVEHGVQRVFGYPGGQITPIYDALYREPSMRHILARDEQAAAFMADGYARATGQPGVCLAVCGPGVFNAATPLATAMTDSIPVLLISGQVAKAGQGMRSGYYHENDQLNALTSITKWRTRVEEVESIVPELSRAFTMLTNQRPGPVLFEVPVDVLRADGSAAPLPSSPTVLVPLAPRANEMKALAELVSEWKKPVLLVGGGAVTAGAGPLVVQLAERLGAPVFNTPMGKGIIPADHPRAAGLPWHRATSDLSGMEEMFSPLLKEADGLLAIGCRFTQLTTGTWTMPMPPSLGQIDVDPAEIGRHYPVTAGVRADARQALSSLLRTLPTEPRSCWAPPAAPLERSRFPGFDPLEPLRWVLPRDAIIAADITRLSYLMVAEFPVYQPRTFLHPAAFVSMGYGIPAAVGAKAAFPERVVVAVVGDGCFLMSGMELATAVQESLPIVVILVNDGSLTLIKSIQQRRYQGRFIGVDLLNPDFGTLAAAFGVRHWRPDSEDGFESALRDAIASESPALIEIRPSAT